MKRTAVRRKLKKLRCRGVSWSKGKFGTMTVYLKHCHLLIEDEKCDCVLLF